MPPQQTNFALDKLTGDLVLGSDNQIGRTLTTLDTLEQRIRTRLQTFRGEYYLNEALGVPYYEEVLRKNPDVPSVRALLLAELLRVPGVKSAKRFTVEFNTATRSFQIDFHVISDDGVPVEGVL